MSTLMAAEIVNAVVLAAGHLPALTSAGRTRELQGA